MTSPTRLRRPLLVGAAAVALGTAALALYGTGGAGNSTAAACSGAKVTAERLGGLARGEVAAVTVPKEPKKLPNLAFSGPDGQQRTLADYKGRTVLLNLWAT